MKSTERNLEAKQCVDAADEDDSLPPVRSASQQNHAYKVTVTECLTSDIFSILLCGVSDCIYCI